MPTPITINVNFIDLTGSNIVGYMEAAIVPPTGVNDLYVAGIGIISPKTLTSTPGTSVSLSVWGNDVIVDAADGATDTYYTVNLFNTVNQLIWSAAYLFTGSGPINLVGFPVLNPVPSPVPPSFPVVQPPGGANTDVQYNNGGVFGGDGGLTYRSSISSPTLTSFSTLTVVGNGVSSTTPTLELQGTGSTNADGPAFYLTPVSGAGNTGATRQTFLIAAMDPTGGGGITFLQNGRAGGGFTFQGSTGGNPGSLEVGVYGITNPNALTEIQFFCDGGIGLFVNTLAASPSILFGGDGNNSVQGTGSNSTSLVNTAAATVSVPQPSPALVFNYNRWDVGTGPSTATSWTLQGNTASFQGTTNAAMLNVFPTGTGIEQVAVNVTGNVQVSGGFFLPSAGQIGAGTNSTLTFQSAGNLDVKNNSGSGDSGSLSFSRGITPSTRPAIYARNASTALNFRTANDSADIAITAASFNGLTTPATSGSAVITQTIASGTASLGTSLIASGAKASTVTVGATGVVATDTLLADFNADPTGVTGYTPSASGMLTIIKFPTSGNVNFIVINNTGSSITPGAITLNWRVVR